MILACASGTLTCLYTHTHTHTHTHTYVLLSLHGMKCPVRYQVESQDAKRQKQNMAKHVRPRERSRKNLHQVTSLAVTQPIIINGARVIVTATFLT